jgi:FlaA1/EpsC-like NDP-sugar epimerase
VNNHERGKLKSFGMSHDIVAQKRFRSKLTTVSISYLRNCLPTHLNKDLASKMVVVAVAGGSGDMGRLIVDALVTTHRHEVYVISRKVRLLLQDNDQAYSNTGYASGRSSC